jgi:hypothetical protein
MELVSPFQVLTLIVAPAVLTNSSSVLALSTSNRFARAVDRSRALYEKLKKPEQLSAVEHAVFCKQLPIISRRSRLLVRALTAFYVSVGSFAATALISLLGAGLEMFRHALASQIFIGLAVFFGCMGVLGLLSGTGLLVVETWVALRFLELEVETTESLPEPG